MIRKIKFLFASLVLFFGLILTASANTVDFSKKGSIEIILEEDINNKIKGAEITLYHIADVKEIDNNLVFSLKSELSECNINLDDLADNDLVHEISKCNIEATKKQVSITNTSGIVKFDDLDLGLYLVKQTKSVKEYSDIDSFLVELPKVEEKSWIYDIKSKPKTDIYKVIDLIIEKKWNSHNKDIPKEVTIELYDGANLIDTVKLNENNNWTYTFSNIKFSDKYRVKEINVPEGYKPSYKQKDFIFTVTNTDKLADSGQIFYPIIILSILGFILIIIGIRVIKSEA